MRVIVLFDLPVSTSQERKQYRTFRKNLIKSGFIMVQESVYSKLVPNSVAADSVISGLYKIKPENGLVQAIRVTEKQYNNMDYIVGSRKTDVIDTDERLVVI